MSVSLGSGSGRLDPDEVVEGELELFVGDAGGTCVERRARPAPRPGVDQPPRVHDAAARSVELADRHRAALLAPLGEALPPVVELAGLSEGAAQDDGLED